MLRFTDGCLPCIAILAFCLLLFIYVYIPNIEHHKKLFFNESWKNEPYVAQILSPQILFRIPYFMLKMMNLFDEHIELTGLENRDLCMVSSISARQFFSLQMLINKFQVRLILCGKNSMLMSARFRAMKMIVAFVIVIF